MTRPAVTREAMPRDDLGERFSCESRLAPARSIPDTVRLADVRMINSHDQDPVAAPPVGTGAMALQANLEHARHPLRKQCAAPHRVPVALANWWPGRRQVRASSITVRAEAVSVSKRLGHLVDRVRRHGAITIDIGPLFDCWRRPGGDSASPTRKQSWSVMPCPVCGTVTEHLGWNPLSGARIMRCSRCTVYVVGTVPMTPPVSVQSEIGPIGPRPDSLDRWRQWLSSSSGRSVH